RLSAPCKRNGLPRQIANGAGHIVGGPSVPRQEDQQRGEKRGAIHQQRGEDRGALHARDHSTSWDRPVYPLGRVSEQSRNVRFPKKYLARPIPRNRARTVLPFPSSQCALASRPGAVKAAVQCAEGAALGVGRNARPCIQRGMASATRSPGRTFLLCRIGHSHFATTQRARGALSSVSATTSWSAGPRSAPAPGTPPVTY